MESCYVRRVSKLEKYIMICKSSVKSQFLPNRDKDLIDLDETEVRNPHYRSASNMVLYSKADVMRKFCQKYQVQNQDAEQKLWKELEKLQKSDRKNKLRNVLKQLRLPQDEFN